MRITKVIGYLLPLLFVCLVVGGGFIVLRFTTGSWWPAQAGLLHWDANWYHSIVVEGYRFDPNAANNTAFFPLFPYLWKALGFSPAAMAVTNGLLFLAGTYWLFRHFPAGIKIRSIFLALSLIVFYTMPMSESLFFLFSTLLLAGLQTYKPPLIIIALIGCGLCRSVSTIFLPAFLVMALLSYRGQQARLARHYLLYALVSLLVLFLVFFIHWYQTGQFFAFYKTQAFWYARFHIPGIPFSTWQPRDNGYVDQFVLLLAFLTVLYLGYYFVRTIRSRVQGIAPATLMALLYIGGTAMLMLMTKGGGFNSINRYILCTPFFYLFLRQVQTFRFTTPVIIFILLFGVVYYLVGWHAAVSLSGMLISLSVLVGMCALAWLIRKDTRYTGLLTVLFIIAALYVQAIFWSRFVSGIWVG